MGNRAREIYEVGRSSNPQICKQLFDELLEVDTTGEYICLAGYKWSWFDHKRAFDRLLEIDRTGEWIYIAGGCWKWFDYEKGLKRLIEVDKTGKLIYIACKEWQICDYQKAFNALMAVDKTGKYIYWAGIFWKPFNHKHAFDKLLEIDKTGEWIYHAGVEWKWFDHKRALDRLADIVRNDRNNIEYMINIPKGWRVKDVEFIRKYIRYIEELCDEEYTINHLLNMLKSRRLGRQCKEIVIEKLIEIGIPDNADILENSSVKEFLQDGITIENPSKKIVAKFIDDII